MSAQEATADAARIRAEAEREAAAYLEVARRRADAFAEARIARLRELSDRLIATAETVEQRFEDATVVKRQLDDLVAALGAAAERAAQETHAPAETEVSPSGARKLAPSADARVVVLEPARTPSRATVP